jgi:hypothetical protein
VMAKKPRAKGAKLLFSGINAIRNFPKTKSDIYADLRRVVSEFKKHLLGF